LQTLIHYFEIFIIIVSILHLFHINYHISPSKKHPLRIIYTTNIIEGLHRQFRKVTKTKTMFPNDSSLEKVLYLASMNVVKKWTQRYKNWDKVLSQLMIQYPVRLEKYI